MHSLSSRTAAAVAALLLAACLVRGQQPGTAFPDSQYGRYDWRSFLKSRAAGSGIDLAHPDTGLLNASVFYCSCRFRESQGGRSFQFSAGLRDAAMYHSSAMSRRRFFAHDNPYDASMRTPSERFSHFGVRGRFVAENLATVFLLNYESGRKFWYKQTGSEIEFFYGSSLHPDGEIMPRTYAEFGEAALTQLAASPPHRKNLLDRNQTMLGCGIVLKQSVTVEIPTALCTQDFAGK